MKSAVVVVVAFGTANTPWRTSYPANTSDLVVVADESSDCYRTDVAEYALEFVDVLIVLAVVLVVVFGMAAHFGRR